MASSLMKFVKNGQETHPKLVLEYGTASCKFGKCLLAFRHSTLCYLSFYDAVEAPLSDLQKTWTDATLVENADLVASKALHLFNTPSSRVELYLKGTDFEVSVWEALLKLQPGSVASYQEIARAVGRPKAVRAAASAVGRNRIGYFVPCHRVVSKSGAVCKYKWGAHRKLRMLKEEGALSR